MSTKCPGLTQHLVDQSGFAVVYVGDDRHVAQVEPLGGHGGTGRGGGRGIRHVGQHSFLGKGVGGMHRGSLWNPTVPEVGRRQGAVIPKKRRTSTDPVEATG